MWKDTVCLITGGASGIGSALAKNLAERGSKVILLDINEEVGQKVATECGENASFYTLDVRDLASYRQRVQNVLSKNGKIDVLFSNAGIGVAGETYELDPGLWDRIIDVNIKGVLNGIHAVYPYMVQRKSGIIVNTASLGGLSPLPLMTPYSMTKHAVVGLSKSLRLEAKKYGVQVNALCPAAVETPLLKAANPVDLPAVSWIPDTVRYLTRLAGAPYDLGRFASDAIKEIEADKGVIVLPRKAKWISVIGRIFPWLTERSIIQAMQNERSFRSEV